MSEPLNWKVLNNTVHKEAMLIYTVQWCVCGGGGATIKLNSTHTDTRLTALCPGLPGKAGTRKVKPIWILLKQETVSGSGISWAVCKSAPRSRQITTPAPHYSVFYRPDALPAAQPTVSKHWRHKLKQYLSEKKTIHLLHPVSPCSTSEQPSKCNNAKTRKWTSSLLLLCTA